MRYWRLKESLFISTSNSAFNQATDDTDEAGVVTENTEYKMQTFVNQ